MCGSALWMQPPKGPVGLPRAGFPGLALQGRANRVAPPGGGTRHCPVGGTFQGNDAALPSFSKLWPAGETSTWVIWQAPCPLSTVGADRWTVLTKLEEV